MVLLSLSKYTNPWSSLEHGSPQQCPDAHGAISLLMDFSSELEKWLLVDL